MIWSVYGVFGPFFRSTQTKGTSDKRGPTYLGLWPHLLNDTLRFNVISIKPQYLIERISIYRGVLGCPLVFDNAYGQ